MHNVGAGCSVGNRSAARVLGVDEGLVGRVIRDVVGDEWAEVRQPPPGGNDVVERGPNELVRDALAAVSLVDLGVSEYDASLADPVSDPSDNLVVEDGFECALGCVVPDLQPGAQDPLPSMRLVWTISSNHRLCRRVGRRRGAGRNGTVEIVTRSTVAPPRQLTARGLATRTRIVDAAADLMYVKGVNATTLDDVRAASSTSKSQLYQHFADKDQLVRAVVSRRAGQILEREQGYLERLRSFRGLQRWRDALVQRNALQNGAYGCALGSMASELSDQDDEARKTLAEAFAEWTGLIAAGLRRMQDAGSLSTAADPDKLAVGLMAALQGGYLLAETQNDITPMETALDMALDHIRSFLTK